MDSRFSLRFAAPCFVLIAFPPTFEGGESALVESMAMVSSTISSGFALGVAAAPEVVAPDGLFFAILRAGGAADRYGGSPLVDKKKKSSRLRKPLSRLWLGEREHSSLMDCLCACWSVRPVFIVFPMVGAPPRTYQWTPAGV